MYKPFRCHLLAVIPPTMWFQFAQELCQNLLPLNLFTSTSLPVISDLLVAFFFCENVCTGSGGLSSGEMLGEGSCFKGFLLLKVLKKAALFSMKTGRGREGEYRCL